MNGNLVATLVQHRRAIRYLAAAMAAATSAMYFLIGFQVVAVISVVSDQPAFAIPAGIGFALAAVVLLLFDVRALWVVGSVMQALIILMYFGVSTQRTPQFETWGILIRIAQLVLLGSLLILAAVPRRLAAASPTSGAHGVPGGRPA